MSTLTMVSLLTVFHILGVITLLLKSMAKLAIDFRGRRFWPILNTFSMKGTGQKSERWQSERRIKETSFLKDIFLIKEV